jgi:hypothetical protein
MKNIVVLKSLVFILILIWCSPLYGQWMKAYGRDHGDFLPFGLQSTPDGGFIACGFLGGGRQWDTDSFNWVVKFLNTGDVEWARSYDEEFFTISPTAEGGFIAAGWHGVFKLDALGYIEWQTQIQKHYFESIRQTRDGRYITIANRGGGLDWGEKGHRIFKLSASGKVEWKKEFAIGDHGRIADVRETLDGNFIVVGDTGFYKDGHGFWILRLSGKGKLLWQKVYAGANELRVNNLVLASDGSFLTLGHTYAWHGLDPYQAIWITKILPQGDVAWHRLYEGGNPWPYDMCATPDGGCVVAGFAETGGIVFKTSGSGEIGWERSFGDFQGDPIKADDRAFAVCPDADGGYTVLGTSETLGHIPDPEYTSHNYLVLLKVSADGFFPECPYTKSTQTIQSKEKSFPMNPLTFGFRKPMTDFFRTPIDVRDLDLTVVENLCTWNSENGKKTINKGKRSGRKRKNP